MTPRFRRTWLLSTVALAGLAFVASGLTTRAAAGQKDEKASKEVQAKKENPEAAALEKIEAKLRGLEQEVKELRAAGKDEAAEKLAREGRELKAALQKQDAGKGKKDADDRRVLELQLKDLASSIKELKATGSLDEAEKRERQYRELKEKQEKLEGDAAKSTDGEKRTGKKPEARKPDAEAAERAKIIVLQLRDLEYGINDARAAGKLDIAEKLERQASEFREQLVKLESDAARKPEEKKPVDKKPEAKKPTGEAAELAARIDAMQHEAAKLREAGRTQEAEKILSQVAELRERSKLDDGKGKPEKDKPMKGEDVKRDKAATSASPELAAAVKELREEVSRLRNEVAELRKMVGKEKGDQPRREKTDKKDDDDKKDSKTDK